MKHIVSAIFNRLLIRYFGGALTKQQRLKPLPAYWALIPVKALNKPIRVRKEMDSR